MLPKWLKNFQWMNIRVGKGFWKEKMENLIGSTSFTKTVKLKQLILGRRRVYSYIRVMPD